MAAYDISINDDDLPTVPRGNVRVAETPEEITRAEALAKSVARRIQRSDALAGMSNDGLIAAAMLDAPCNLLAVELANRLHFIMTALECTGAGDEVADWLREEGFSRVLN